MHRLGSSASLAVFLAMLAVGGLVFAFMRGDPEVHANVRAELQEKLAPSEEKDDKPATPAKLGPVPTGDPTSFAAIKADGQLAVVDAATWKTLRSITRAGPRGLGEVSVSPDRKTIYFSRGDGSCASHIASVPVAGGSEQVVRDAKGGPEYEPEARPRHSQIAFVRGRCDGPGQQIVVAAIGDGTGEASRAEKTVSDLSWSPDGKLLAAYTDEIQVFEVNNDGDITGVRSVSPPDGCDVSRPSFGADGVVVVRTCAPDRIDVVQLDAELTVKRTLFDVAPDMEIGSTFDFDGSGQYLLYSLGTAGGRDVETIYGYADGDSTPVAADTSLRSASW